MRHGVPAVLRVDAGGMMRDGFVFYLSENGVWLVERVPVKYLGKVTKAEQFKIFFAAFKKIVRIRQGF